jgi:RNA polymerase-interacting CarD/CdnL/TRCF family regulator
MKSIKKFSATSNKGTSILESATLTPEALAELVKKLGYNNIDEIKKEKALLSKLESLLKEVNPKEDISEDDAEDIEDKVNSIGEPKSLEDMSGDKEEGNSTKDEETEVSEEEDEEEDEEDTSKEIEDDIVDLGEPEEKEEEEGETVITNNQEITDEVEEETEKKPVATRRIMTFEDFTKEDVTINKKVSYQDDEEEDEDAALPVADSVDTAKEVKESDTVKNSPIKSFSKFVSESYHSEEADNGPELKDEEASAANVVVPIAKGDGAKSSDEIAAKLVAMGKPEKKNSKEGEDLVTKDQEITEDPETSKDEVDVHGKVVVTAVTESHFNVGDTVEMSHGGTGVIVSLDKEDGAEDEKYYNVKLPNGDMMKHAPNELTKVMTVAKVNEAKDIKSDAEFKEYAEAMLKKAHGDNYDEAKAKEVIDGLKSKYKEDFGAMVGALQSAMG